MAIGRRAILAALAALLVAGAARSDDGNAPPPPREREERRGAPADVTGWIYGMYLGENAASFYPYVIEVDPGGVARSVGIRRGDEIVRFQDREFRSLRELHRAMSELRVGHRVRLLVRRGAQMIAFEFVVPPDATASPDARAAQQARERRRDERQARTPRKPRKPPTELTPLPPPPKSDR